MIVSVEEIESYVSGYSEFIKMDEKDKFDLGFMAKADMYQILVDENTKLFIHCWLRYDDKIIVTWYWQTNDSYVYSVPFSKIFTRMPLSLKKYTLFYLNLFV